MARQSTCGRRKLYTEVRIRTPQLEVAMREYRARTIQVLAASTCDRCHRRLTPDDPGEWQERLSLDHSCGFDSVFGDGSTVSLDLCQHCVREVLGEWLRVGPPVAIDEIGEAQEPMNMPASD